MRTAALFVPSLVTASLALCPAADVREKAPGPDADGKVYAWRSSDGLEYHYFIPRSYDAEKGAALTLILHGSNLSKGWGFANHPAGKFRPDDIVVCPDGTASNGRGGFNFLGRDKDIDRLEALQNELGEALKINATYLYGHSQGSFFALHYAGAKPELVDGVLAQASGSWAASKRPRAGRGQVIVLMHGTQDPVVSYGQSVGALETYQDAGYKNVRLKSLEGWNHWPAEQGGPVPHTSRQLSWIEGMTTDDPNRVGAAFRDLNDESDKEWRDFQALYTLSARILTMPEVSSKASTRAKEVMANIDSLAAKHIASMRSPDPGDVDAPDDSPWIGSLPMFLRAFKGVPAADKFSKQWERTLKRQREAAIEHFGDYRKALSAGDKAKAFQAGLEVLSEAFLTYGAADKRFHKNMENWADDRSLEIPKDDLKAFKTLIKDHRDAIEDGAKSFWSENRKARL